MYSCMKHYKKQQIRDKQFRRFVNTEHLYRSPTQSNHLLVNFYIDHRPKVITYW